MYRVICVDLKTYNEIVMLAMKEFRDIFNYQETA